MCESQPRPPGLAAFLVTTPAGNILINANLETSPPQIRASVEKLGFQWADPADRLRNAVIVGGVGFWSDFRLIDAGKEGPQVFLDAAGYKEFVAKGQAAFETALEKEEEAARTSR